MLLGLKLYRNLLKEARSLPDELARCVQPSLPLDLSFTEHSSFTAPTIASAFNQLSETREQLKQHYEQIGGRRKRSRFVARSVAPSFISQQLTIRMFYLVLTAATSRERRIPSRFDAGDRDFSRDSRFGKTCFSRSSCHLPPNASSDLITHYRYYSL